NHANYCQFDYVDEALADLFAASDFVVSRAGANALYEILVLEKPHVLIPLSRRVSRGDQIQNARYFEQLGISLVIEEEVLSADKLLAALNQLILQRESIIQKIHALHIEPATVKIVEMILAISK
ncbi:UDP-N-acetylglucosamine--N-acetylmuramyl-(pentapeptide) pyrophosphoryl-undecaprenol N-acetylglucosamine transferase, partial [bacterium]|nr:UDP-N-acetylglucosamine--N-acetylmuramyl-(pentapeptide) pyrophosphoryl-undecaprenol N-acetylglucosamine transferase [bacterium]